MTLRTPRRRISPRTKRRYRAIKDFLRRAIGTTSQPDIKINSSIAVNVTNLKHQIVDAEQPNEGSLKHCTCTECTSTNDSQSYITRVNYRSSATAKDSRCSTARVECRTLTTENTESSSDRKPRESKTKLLFQKLNDRKSDDSELLEKSEFNCNEVENVNSKIDRESPKPGRRTKKSRRRKHVELKMEQYLPFFEKHKSKSAYEQFSSAYSANSYHSLFEPRCPRTSRGNFEEHHHRRHTSKHDRQQPYDNERQRMYDRGEIRRDFPDIESKEVTGKRVVRHEDKNLRRRKEKYAREARDLDPDFISNIIKRQYKPVTMFGNRESNLSQFSAPVCRDQEFSIPENIIEGSDLCSCFYTYRKPKHPKYNDFSEIRSICDTRLYSSNRNTRQKSSRRQTNYYNYNDSSMYDVVPVKEKSSPKTRRKFIEDMMCHPHYKEVPPSPRTQRPRLNLKAQHLNNMEFIERDHYRTRKYSPNRNNRRRDYIDSCSNDSSTVINEKIPCHFKTIKQDIIQQTVGTSSTLPQALFMNEATIAHQPDTTNTTSIINKSQDVESNTDKALCEIKVILQTFLQEIKKESISPIDKEVSSKSEGNQSSEIKQNNTNSSFEKASYHSDINNCSMSPFAVPSPIPPPYLPPPYMNPCACYPVLPTYPINCMQNSYVVPTPSFTCANCANKMEQTVSPNNENATNNNIKTNTETDKLIKEIYNLVTQSPPSSSRREDKSMKSHKTVPEKRRPVVTRSVGDSVRITRHDAKVGTPKLKYYSKSCEAIGSQLDVERTDRANTSYSDTVLEKLSMDTTVEESSSTETGLSTDDTTVQKKGSRFSNALRSIGLLKKKKDVIEEEEEEESSESESSTEVQVKKKHKKPEFPQAITNYMMHGQEYYHPPPLSPHLHHEYVAHQQGLHLHHPYGPYPGYPVPPYHPTAPPCPCALDHNQYPKSQEAPLCLKEIEVKSTATQSERKFSFFGKFGKKTQEAQVMMPRTNSMPPPRNFSTQTAVPEKPKRGFWERAAPEKPKLGFWEKAVPEKPKLGFWERLQVPKQPTESDPRVFSFKKQKELAAGDVKMKKAMLQKLFHKRNPFSPGNLIVRTLLGKDPSSFGEAPHMYRPRMFL